MCLRHQRMHLIQMFWTVQICIQCNNSVYWKSKTHLAFYVEQRCQSFFHHSLSLCSIFNLYYIFYSAQQCYDIIILIALLINIIIVMLHSLSSQNADLSPATTLHVDSFLYSSEDQVDQLCSQLEISRNYCLNCGSWKTLPLSKHNVTNVAD